MANLTITIDDALLRRARLRALEQGTSVNALLRDYLTAYAGEDDLQQRAVADLLQLSEAATSRRGEAAWTRDDLHAREEAGGHPSDAGGDPPGSGDPSGARDHPT